MKCTDDYLAKVKFWAAAPCVRPLPYAVRIPGLRRMAFSSHAEMNRWKREQLRTLAVLPPEQWQIKLR